MKKRILITGATGFLGFRTTEALAEKEDVEQIIAAGRTLKKDATVVSGKVEYCLGDLQDMDYVHSLFEKGITHIVHCAALSSPWGKYQEFYQANVIPQKNLIEAAELNGIKRFIYISTPSIYFDFKDKWNVSEKDPLPQQFVNQYAVTKREAEILLEQSNLEFISLRPRALIGRGDTVILPRLIRAVKENKLKIIGSGKNKVDVTSVANVVEAIYLSLNADNNSLNEHYNISNGNPVDLWEMIGSTLNQLNLSLPENKIPFVVIKNIAAVMELFARIFSLKEPVLTKYSVGTLAMNFTMDITKAKDKLNYQAIMTTEEAVEEFVVWYKKKQLVEM